MSQLRITNRRMSDTHVGIESWKGASMEKKVFATFERVIQRLVKSSMSFVGMQLAKETFKLLFAKRCPVYPCIWKRPRCRPFDRYPSRSSSLQKRLAITDMDENAVWCTLHTLVAEAVLEFFHNEIIALKGDISLVVIAFWFLVVSDGGENPAFEWLFF